MATEVGFTEYEPWSDLEQSDLDPYCLQYRLTKNINRGDEQRKKGE